MNELKLEPISQISYINAKTSFEKLQNNSPVSFVPMADVTDSGQWFNHQIRLLKEVARGFTPFKEGDVLFAKITPCMENGKGAHAVGLMNGVGFGTTEFHVLRAKEGVSSRYLYHLSMSEMLRKKAAAQMIGSAGQQRVPADFFNKFEAPFFQFDEQGRIADILDTVDEVIQRTEQLIAKLKAIKQGLLHDLLTRGLHENGQLRDPIVHPEQFKDSPLGKIPKDWDVLSIGEISCYVGSGLTPHGGSKVYKDFGVMFIRSQNVTFDGLKLNDIVFIDWKTHELMNRSQVFPYDVLVNITGASIGRCCYLPDGVGPTNVNQHVCAIRMPSPCHEDAIHLTSVLASYIGQHQINLFNAGSNREGLNYQQLRTIFVPWPKKEEREVISQQLLYFDTNTDAEQKYLSKLKLIKKGLMHDLLTGKVRVNIKTENLNQVKEGESL